jgi:hypothetical protein
VIRKNNTQIKPGWPVSTTHVYPNPVKNTLSVILPQAIDYRFVVFDIYGRALHRAEGTGSAVSLYLSDIAAVVHIPQV